MSTQKLPEDIFRRKPVAQRMCKIIAELEHSAISPLALDGSWGSGKTIHAQRIKEEFTSNYSDSIKCLYWNASKSDYFESPLLAFISFLYRQIDDTQKKQFKKNSFLVYSRGALSGLLSIANQTVASCTGINAKEVYKDVSSTVSEMGASNNSMEVRFASLLDEVGEETSCLQAAHELLHSVRGDKKLIIIIDELDRCKPDFALKILENIKHLFSVDECKFILVMNKASVANSIEKMYGLKGEASESYLDKYIKMTFQLPPIFQMGYSTKSNCAKAYFIHLMGGGDWDNVLVKDFLDFLINEKKASLREVEKMVSTISFIDKVSCGSLDKTGDFNTFFICYLAYLFALNHNLAMQIAARETDTDIVLDDLGWELDVKKRPGLAMPKYVECLKPILDIYFSSGEAKERLIASYPKTRHGSELEKRSDLFEMWMEYSAFILL